MEILQIDLYRFLSHYETSISFKDSKPYLLIGKNGSGKSSAIKDSITWALFGESRAKGAGDDLIYNSEPKVKVSILFRVNNDKYLLIRERERGKKTNIKLFSMNGVCKDITNVTATKTQEVIEKIIGFNYNLFAVSACLEQNSKLNFSELTPKECKDIVMKILDIDKYNGYEKICRDKVTVIEREIKSIEDRIAYNNEQIKKYVSADEQMKQLKLERTNLEEQIASEKTKRNEKKEQLENEIKALEEQINKSKERVEELRLIYKGKEQESLELAQKISAIGTEISRIQQRLLKIQKLGTKCPMCESELEDAKVKKLLDDSTAELNQQKLLQSEVLPKFEQIRKDIDKIESEGKAIRAVENLNKLKSLNQELNSVLTTKDLEIENKINSLNQDISKLEIKNDFIQEKQNEIENDNKTLIRWQKEKSHYAILQDAFGKKGIPAMIISNVTNELEFHINVILRELTNKNMSVKVSTEKNLKTKEELSDTLEIIIRDDLLERPYQMYSGGEKYRIDLAIRLALSKILARRNNFKLETLIIDEPSGLDQEGLNNFKDAIYRLSQTFRKIFVISHLQELVEDSQERFKIVEVKSNNGISTVTIN